MGKQSEATMLSQPSRNRAVIKIRAYGIPAPAGSKRGFIVRTKAGAQQVVLTDASKRNKPWQETVRRAAIEAMNGAQLIRGACSLSAIFYMPRPKGHFGKRGLRPGAPHYPSVRPDRGKLLRAVEDALRGIVIHGDELICEGAVTKAYATEAESPGVILVVEELEP